MRRANASRGVFLCFLINLFLNFEWAVIAAILFGLHVWLHIPWFFAAIIGAFWVIQAFVLAILVQWGSRSSAIPTPEQSNTNPYSAKNDTVFPSSGSDDMNTNQ